MQCSNVAGVVAILLITADAPPAGQFESISLGESAYPCGIRSGGELVCWGVGSLEANAKTDSGPYQSVATGMGHACGLRQNGRVQCWGEGAMSVIQSPSGVFEAIASGQSKVCGITESREAVCWSARGLPVAQPPAGKFTRIAVGQYSACGIREKGDVDCWGHGPGGTPVISGLRTPARKVAVGAINACALGDDGAIACSNMSPPSGSFTDIHATGMRWCALSKDGRATCWSELGGSAVTADGTFKQVSAGGTQDCGISGGLIKCWDRSGNLLSRRPSLTTKVVSDEQVAGAKHKAILVTIGVVALVALVGARLMFGRRPRRRRDRHTAEDRPR